MLRRPAPRTRSTGWPTRWSTSRTASGRHPELCFEEHRAHDLLCDTLDAIGVPATRHAYELDTAFEASAGSQGPTVAVLCEYDALPDIGHACGHNVIAAAGLGAGLAAAVARRGARRTCAHPRDPAEEGGGGKVFMIREGAFEGSTPR